MDSLEHVIREKLEAHFVVDAFAYDLQWLLREWRAELDAAAEDWTKVVHLRSYWDAYVP
jgi:hypothetical protein